MKPNKIRVIDFIDTLGPLIYISIIDGSFSNVKLTYYTSSIYPRIHNDVPEDLLAAEITDITFKDDTIFINIGQNLYGMDTRHLEVL